jgi:omega-amidase
MLRISLIQTPLHWEAEEKNLTDLELHVRALAGKTDLIVLPEMFTTGFSMNAAALAVTMNSKAVHWMRSMAVVTGAVITGSLIIADNNRFYNRLIWMQPDGKISHYDKRHLFRLAGEEKVYTQGDERKSFEWKGWRISPLICYDLRFPVWSRRTASFEYDLLLIVANWPERRSSAWKKLLPARAIENQCYIAAVNRTGNDGHGIHHSGDSVVLDFLGEPLDSASGGEVRIVSATLEKKKLMEFRSQFPFSADADTFELIT